MIYNYPEEIFKAAGVLAIEHSDFDGTERLAAVLGGDIVSTFDAPDQIVLGSCAKIEEVMIGIFFYRWNLLVFFSLLSSHSMFFEKIQKE